MNLLAQLRVKEQSFMDKVIDPIKASFEEMWHNIVDMLPNVIAAIVIFVVGYIVARLIGKGLGTTLKRIKFDGVLEKVGVAGVLKKIGMKASPSEVLAKVVFYLIMLFIVKIAADKLAISDIAVMIEEMIAFLPRLILAGIILLFGFILAELVQNASRAALEAMNLDYAKPLSNILFGFVFVIILTVALDQLDIQTELLNASVMIILGALGVAMAIALGMGLRNLAKAIVSGVYARDVYKPGTEIEIDGELARVAGVGPVTTKLQTKDGGFLMIPNAELIELRVKGQSAD